VTSHSGDELIEMLLAGEDFPGEEGKAANDLLLEVLRGYPAQNLGRLIHSDNSKAVDSGAFVVSELGARSAQILDEVDFLLSHPSRNARFDALDAVLTSASDEHGTVIAKAIMLVADPDQAVRWKALQFLARSTPDQLAAAIPSLTDRHVADLAAWLGAIANDATHLPDILGRLRDPDKTTRLFAAAAAARVAASDRQGIEQAATSTDPEIHSFAESVISMLDLDRKLRIRREQERRDRG
jgi:hypothetical protein